MKRYIVVICATLLLAGCEKMIEIDSQYQEPIIVVHSRNNVGENVSLAITTSRPVFGYHPASEASINSPFPAVENATATLTVNGNAHYTATSDSNHYTFAYQTQVGDKLQLEVQVPGHDPLYAETTVPAPAQATTTVQTVETDWDEQNRLHITLTDPANQENYYSVQIREIYHYTAGDRYDTTFRYFTCKDPLLVGDDPLMGVINDMDVPSFDGTCLLFDDSRINGTTYSFDVQYHPNRSTSDQYTYTYDLVLTSFSTEEYHFATSIQNNADYLFGLFSEPAVLYNNVKGGYGVFGAHHTTIIRLEDPADNQ